MQLRSFLYFCFVNNRDFSGIVTIVLNNVNSFLYSLALESIEPGTVYVLGGLVDETVSKKLTLNLADKAGIRTRRLPIPEYMCRTGRHSNYSTVFCVNQGQ